MLKWSTSPVRRLCRSLSTVRYPAGGGVGDVEAILRRKSTLRPPSTVKRSRVPGNSCSFIGQITAPVRLHNSKTHPGVYTFLEIKGPFSKQTTSSLEICISMMGELEQVSLQYLRPKQYVYVAGHLSSYKKVNLSGPDHVLYKVEVQEWSFVRTHNHIEVPCKAKEDPKNEEMALAASSTNPGLCDVNKEERIREREILWQIFFANPFEWRDQRTTKRNPRQPDFKHKSSGEALWNKSDDPPWIKKQLNLYDSKMSEINLFRKKEEDDIQGWKIQDFFHL
ncbi:hypothetical protein LUZ63_014348 [Rhynchospora breviuscula]|uniref:Uncharacterized protein n=1 Tax=Rhynchospora breviuscula TaxID=2022672 RepID=A0A9Q0HLI7_9POAL|nr:hypothetical protein LUZ63_014348 [Rhynchospora breviuscula]